MVFVSHSRKQFMFWFWSQQPNTCYRRMHQTMKSFGFCSKFKKPVIFTGFGYLKKDDSPHMLMYVYLLKHTYFEFECKQQYWGGFGMYLVQMWWLHVAVVPFLKFTREDQCLIWWEGGWRWNDKLQACFPSPDGEMLYSVLLWMRK